MTAWPSAVRGWLRLLRSLPSDAGRPVGVSGALERLFPPQDYSRPGRYRPPAGWYRRLNHLGVPLTMLGWAPAGAVTLEVRGRRSGRRRRIPVLVTDHDGAQFLVALAGESEWVRNVRAAGGRAALCRRGRRHVVLEEVPVEQRAPVLAAYLAAGRERSGQRGAALQARYNFGLTEPEPARLHEVAPRYPVFRITDVSPHPSIPPESGPGG